MMGRIASLVGVTDSGDLVNVGLGNHATINDLMAVRKAIQDCGGVWKKGSREVKLTELYTLANKTAGGEMKSRLKFT